MIAERRGGGGPPGCNVDFHAVFYFEKTRFIKGEGGGRLKDPPPATPLLRRTIRITHA